MILKERKIQTFVGDPTNCYIILDEQSKEIMCIDPAGDAIELSYMIQDILKGNLNFYPFFNRASNLINEFHNLYWQEKSSYCYNKVFTENKNA